MSFLEHHKLPDDLKLEKKIALQSPLFTMDKEVLIFIDPKQKQRSRIVVPVHLRHQILYKCHHSLTGRHFSGKRTCDTLSKLW